MATTDMGQKLASLSPFRGGGAGSPSSTMWPGAETYLRAKWHLDPSSRFATTDMGQELGGSAPFGGGGAGSPSNTMWPGLRPTCMPINRLATIHQRHRQDRQTGQTTV